MNTPFVFFFAVNTLKDTSGFFNMLLLIYGVRLPPLYQKPQKNQEYREETERLIDERNHILSDKDHDIAKKEAQLEKVSAELVSEEQKNREIADTNIFDKPKNITMSAQEFRSWQKSAETKESNKLALKAISKGKKDNEAYEKRLLAFKKELDARELSINSTIAKGIADGIKEQLPDAIKQEKRILIRKSSQR